MQPEKTQDFLAQEYLTLQRFTEDFDSRALTIKAWSITFSAAGLGLAYTHTQPPLLLIAAGGALVFWLIEILWKLSQRAYYPRIKAIETHFAEGGAIAPFQITASWCDAYHGPQGWRAAWTFALRPQIALPHALVAVAGVALYV